MRLMFALLVAYQLKHFFADYPLQRPWMLGKFKPGWDFVGPLSAHAAVHALMTLGIVLSVRPLLWWLALVDGGVHFVMDRIKASPRYMGRWKPLTAETYPEAMLTAQTCEEVDGVAVHAARAKLRSNRLFWDALGFDQMVHHLTHYFCIYMLVR